MNIKKIKNSLATASIGSRIGYSSDFYGKSDLIKFIQEKSDLSVEITTTYIVQKGQNEKHYKLSILNYPYRKKLKKYIFKLIKDIMNKFEQNRIILNINNKTYIFEENSDKTDPRINSLIP
jgi:hypothetical protein